MSEDTKRICPFTQLYCVWHCVMYVDGCLIRKAAEMLTTPAVTVNWPDNITQSPDSVSGSVQLPRAAKKAKAT